MNLRYPDKASNEYLEYLNNCTDCNKEHLSLTENDSTETNLVKHLIKTVGTEIDIRNRQLRLIAAGKRQNNFVSNECIVSTQTGLYLSTTIFLNSIRQRLHYPDYSSHGPCISDATQAGDFAFCLTKQYNETIRLTEYVLSKCASEMVFLGKNYYSEADIDPSIPLNVKMKTAVVDDVTYLQHSSLIPKELELEVEDGCFKIPPFTICHCLRFLCYHHIGDTFNKQQALCHLHSTYYVSTTVISNTLTLFGVCSEISGDKDEAVHCYDEALRCVFGTCSKKEVKTFKHLNQSCIAAMRMSS
ncbi:unnamed protein product [Mytilus coruscus]|uniref:Uncharacterized protein n=1 Tax=Mytilus coruscus TaxID=42192 RepID=A0A6J8C1F2_MYTCO|nr:unnamed protein product [Mytilus coruscus]